MFPASLQSTGRSVARSGCISRIFVAGRNRKREKMESDCVMSIGRSRRRRPCVKLAAAVVENPSKDKVDRAHLRQAEGEGRRRPSFALCESVTDDEVSLDIQIFLLSSSSFTCGGGRGPAGGWGQSRGGRGREEEGAFTYAVSQLP